jgi:hypothetical protein
MANFSLKSFLSRAELQREKLKDYRNVVVIQIILIVFVLIFSGPLHENSRSEVSKLIISILSFCGAIYSFLLWDLLRNFSTSKFLIKGIVIVLVAILVIGMLGEFPYYQIIEIPNRQIYLITIHGLFFPIEIIVISFAIRDLFSQGFMSSDKLWGAACVFLMVGISFGSLYDILNTAVPDSLGQNVELGIPNYTECMTHSFCVLAGIDSGIPTSRLVRNISVIEAVWGGLYGMLIIGKLLGLPRAEDEKQIN